MPIHTPHVSIDSDYLRAHLRDTKLICDLVDTSRTYGYLISHVKSTSSFLQLLATPWDDDAVSSLYYQRVVSSICNFTIVSSIHLTHRSAITYVCHKYDERVCEINIPFAPLSA